LFRAILDRFELSPREPDRRPEPAALAFEIGIRDMGAINVVRAFLQTQHTTDHDAVGYTQPFAAQLVGRARKPLPIDFFRLVKVAREQANHGIERFLLVNTMRNDLQIGTTTRSECQDTENRFRIRFGVAIQRLQSETALKLARDADEVRGGARMKTEATGDLDSSFRHVQSAPDFDGGSSKAQAR